MPGNAVLFCFEIGIQLRTNMKIFARVGVALACLCVSSVPAAAQDPLTQAKGLYDSASYTEALSALNEVGGTADVIEVEKYRALCLLALNRPKDAEQSLERLAMTRPLFTLDGADASPKLVALFQDVRKRTLPEASKQSYQRARAVFESGDMAEAARQFKDVIAMAEAASPDNAAMMGDLKMVSAGFLKLAEAALAPNPEVRATFAAPAVDPPATSTAPATEKAPIVTTAAPNNIVPTTTSARPTTPVTAVPPTEALTAAARARIAVMAGGRIYDASDTIVKAAAAIARPIPKWDRPSALNFAAFQGLLQIIVAEDGSVAEATMLKAINPAYDRLLMDTAKNWRFHPATLGDQAVRYRLTYSIEMPAVKR
jgi:TonB family protein